MCVGALRLTRPRKSVRTGDVVRRHRILHPHAHSVAQHHRHPAPHRGCVHTSPTAVATHDKLQDDRRAYADGQPSSDSISADAFLRGARGTCGHGRVWREARKGTGHDGEAAKRRRWRYLSRFQTRNAMENAWTTRTLAHDVWSHGARDVPT
ncbi:hypothetical protein GGX14DRAFT_457287 [Mycena pura]|uniref:Uncharacterized protein n=1 Tax=Mycena pura TaxID=153505 RepID=A0AAD6V9J6_9AGAR|nr:hypothetical protein GGX14DRAFT_457287 [Mycena pura]